MEAITDHMHAHANQNNPFPPANEGDRDIFMVLAYCVAQVIAERMAGFIHTPMRLPGGIVTA